MKLDRFFLKKLFACERCMNFCDKFLEFKRKACENIRNIIQSASTTRVKQMHYTPKRGTTVSSQIEKLDEKLNMLKLGQSERQKTPSSTRSRQRLSFTKPATASASLEEEHLYSKPKWDTKEVQSKEGESAEKFLATLNIDKDLALAEQMKNIATLGNSICFLKDPKELSEKKFSHFSFLQSVRFFLFAEVKMLSYSYCFQKNLMLS